MMTDWSHAFNYRNAVAGIELQAVSHDWKYDIGAGSASNYSPAAGFLVTESWKLVFRTGKTGYTRTRGVPTRTRETPTHTRGCGDPRVRVDPQTPTTMSSVAVPLLTTLTLKDHYN